MPWQAKDCLETAAARKKQGKTGHGPANPLDLDL